MLHVICGPSGSGKSTIARKFCEELNKKGGETAKEVVMTTTRAPRPGEVNGVDYHFISVEEFQDLIKNNGLIYYEEYSGQRFYGVTKKEVRQYFQDLDEEHASESFLTGILVTTPGGLRKLKETFSSEEEEMQFCSYLVECNLGERVKRYIDRIGTDQFNYNDMSEISARVNRDFGMFLGVEGEVDRILKNNGREDMEENMDKMFRAHLYMEDGILQTIRDNRYER